jgi:integrase
MKLACRVRGLRALPLLTLAAIGSHADTKGRGSWPSIGLLAEETGSSEKSVRRAVQVLEAVGVLRVRRHGYLNSNDYEIQIRAWAEVRLLLDKGFKSDPEMRRFYTVAIFTGLRTSELIGLKWTDLDWTSTPPLAVIKHSYTKHDGEHLTKTPGSARPVELRPQVVRALKEQQASSRLKSDFVFCSSVGGPLDRDNLMNRFWYPALKRAGIRDRKPYQTRHTFATLSLSAGEDIGWVAKQMAHVNTKMVIEHYHRFIPNLTRQDGSAFDKAAAQFGL